MYHCSCGWGNGLVKLKCTCDSRDQKLKSWEWLNSLYSGCQITGPFLLGQALSCQEAELWAEKLVTTAAATEQDAEDPGDGGYELKGECMKNTCIIL